METSWDAPLLRHQLCVRLRSLRHSTGLPRWKVATDLGYSESKLVRMELGQVRVSLPDLRALLERYGVDDHATYGELAQLAQASRRLPWACFRDVMSTEEIVYCGYESAANRVRRFESRFVPDVLQTPPYTRALLSEVDAGEDLASGRHVLAQTQRLEALIRPGGPVLSFVLAEAVLLRPPAPGHHGTVVLNQQMNRLKELAVLPSVTIRVLPHSRGLLPGTKVPFTVLELPGIVPGSVYQPNFRSGSLRHEPEFVDRYRRYYDRLAAAAVDLQVWKPAANLPGEPHTRER